MDGDNTHTPRLIFNMLLLIYQGNDIVVTSCYRSGAWVVGVPLFKNS